MAYSVHKRRKRQEVAAFGAILLIFALIGILSIGYIGFTYVTRVFNSGSNEHAEFTRIEEFLTPIVMTNPEPFANPADLPHETRLKISVWFAMNYDVGFLDEIDFDETGRMIIAEDLIRRSHLRLFGSGVAMPVMRSFSYGDDRFEYDVVAQIFRVPLIGLANVYFPRVTSLSRRNNNLYAVVDFIDDDGGEEIVASHTMTFTLTGPHGGEIIHSVSRN